MSFAGDVRHVLGELDSAQIPYMLVGGLSLEALGVPRATLDVDLQVALPEKPTGQFFLDCIIEERSRDVVFGQDVLIMHRPTSAVPFEVFLTSHWFTKQALARRRLVPSRLLQRDVPIPSTEDFILLKLAYGAHSSRTPGKATQDQLDVQAVLQRGASLDRTYLADAAEKLGLSAALQRALGAEKA